MDCMNYDKIDKKNFNIGIFLIVLFIVLGSVVVIYSMINEPQPVIIGQDALVELNDDEVIEVVAEPVKDVNYRVNNRIKNESVGNFKINISLPQIKVDEIEITDINNIIFNKFEERYTTLKEENGKSLENKFTYKVTYKKYETKLENGEKLLSLTIYERIIDDSKGIDTMYKLYGYTINLNKKVLLKQEDISPDLLGPNYKALIKEQVKSYVINNKMILENKYTYSLTGLEEFYVKDGQLHIIFNTGEIVDSKYEHLDITINN